MHIHEFPPVILDAYRSNTVLFGLAIANPPFYRGALQALYALFIGVSYAQNVSVFSPYLGFLFPFGSSDTLEKLQPNQVWQAVLGNLEVQVSRPSFATWLKPTIGLSLENSRMLVGTPSTFHSKWLQTRMSSIIESTLTQVTGYPVT